VQTLAGRGSRARFLGQRRPDDVYIHLRRARLMVHVSLYRRPASRHGGGDGCGLPVVAYRSTIPAGIAHGETGFW
jgi:hypothetical protein